MIDRLGAWHYISDARLAAHSNTSDARQQQIWYPTSPATPAAADLPPSRTLISGKVNARMRDRLENLEEKVDELVALCTALDKENKNLRGRETEWQTERRKLLIKNESARNKVEAMISRLKSMESGE